MSYLYAPIMHTAERMALVEKRRDWHSLLRRLASGGILRRILLVELLQANIKTQLGFFLLKLIGLPIYFLPCARSPVAEDTT